MFAFTATTAFALVASLAAAAPSGGIWNLPNAKATVYYDLTNQLCGNNNPFTDNWAETSGINGGIPSCESWAGASAKSLSALGTNRIVAMDVTKVSGDLAAWCGKEVAIFDEHGKQFQFSEGPLYIWDSCAAAASEPIVDVSAKAFTELKGGTCGGNNPTGLTVQVLNNNIVAPWLQGGGRGSGAKLAVADVPSVDTANLTATTTSSSINEPAASSAPALADALPSTSALVAPAASSAPSSAAPAPTSSAAAASADGPAPTAETSASASTAAEPSAASPAACAYGAWQCNGKDVQVCNYVSTTDTAWVTTGSCPTSCSVTASSVLCV